MPSPSDSARALAGPITSSCALRSLDLSTTDASIDLDAGDYEIVADTATIAFCRIGGATTSLPPSSGAAEVGGAFVIPGGGVVSLSTTGESLHARLGAGTGSLRIVRKAVR